MRSLLLVLGPPATDQLADLLQIAKQIKIEHLVAQAAAEPLALRLGDTGLNVLNRVFGLILAAIAVEVIATGLRQLSPVLGGI